MNRLLYYGFLFRIMLTIIEIERDWKLEEIGPVNGEVNAGIFNFFEIGVDARIIWIMLSSMQFPIIYTARLNDRMDGT